MPKQQNSFDQLLKLAQKNPILVLAILMGVVVLVSAMILIGPRRDLEFEQPSTDSVSTPITIEQTSEQTYDGIPISYSETFVAPESTSSVDLSIYFSPDLEDYDFTLTHPSGVRVTPRNAERYLFNEFVINVTVDDRMGFDTLDGEWQVDISAPQSESVAVNVIFNTSSYFMTVLETPKRNDLFSLSDQVEVRGYVLNSQTGEVDVDGDYEIEVFGDRRRIDADDVYRDYDPIPLEPDPDKPGHYTAFLDEADGDVGTYLYHVQLRATGTTSTGVELGDKDKNRSSEVSITRSNQVRATVKPHRSNIRQGETIIVQATPIDPASGAVEDPVIGADVTMKPFGLNKDPNKAKLPGPEQTMRDDGEWPDLVADDGIYSAALETSEYSPSYTKFQFYVLVESAPSNDDIYQTQWTGAPTHTEDVVVHLVES